MVSGLGIPGEEFASRLASYVKRYLRRGIPSLFTDVKALYVSADKVGTVQLMNRGFFVCLNRLYAWLISGHRGYPGFYHRVSVRRILVIATSVQHLP